MEYTKDFEPHQYNLKRIQAEVKDLHQRKQGFRISHGSTNSTRPVHQGRVVDISCLNRILRIDPDKKTALVEPNVPMDRLLDATLQVGLMPPVVMEFPGITVGGGFAGSAGESSSFKHGFFSETVNWVEVVLGDGKAVKASRSGKEDLFHGAAGDAGTLGIITLLELRLVPAKPYVKLTYRPASSIEEAVASIKKETENPDNDYVDGIVYFRSSAVITTGELTDEKPVSVDVQTFSRPWDPWFYMHVHQRVQDPPEHDDREMVDYIPIRDYLFRYDRGGFWVGRESFRYFGFVPFNGFTRWLLEDFLHARTLYRALHGAKRHSGYMIQDLALPFGSERHFVRHFIKCTTEHLGIWPLWLCPLRGVEGPTFHPQSSLSPSFLGARRQPLLNIGLWGRAAQDPAAFVEESRELERLLHDASGRKVLYSHTYYTEQEFWEEYDQGWYEELRQKYRAETLPSIYEKVHVDTSKLHAAYQSWLGWFMSMWPLAGVAGIAAVVRSGDYVHHRQPLWKRMWEMCVRDKLD
ncbi:hypothetical protein PG988_006360 [Apiospora saccharicola]